MGIRSIRSIEVYGTWQEVDPEHVRGKAVVVVDTLRATTTLSTMLAHGAQAILPVDSVDEARALRQKIPQIILSGERNNEPPMDFDGGNSPLEYPPARVLGRRIALTTTNGTKAITRCSDSGAMAAAALVNAGAAARWLCQSELEGGVIISAGDRGQLALEDWLASGAIVDGLGPCQWSDRARAAHLAFVGAKSRLQAVLSEANHGAQLIAQGMGRDVEFSASLDRFPGLGVRAEDGWFRLWNRP